MGAATEKSDVISLELPYRVANLMVQEKLITQDQLDKARATQKQNGGGKLGTVLLAMGFVKEDEILKFVARQCGLGCMNLAGIPEIADEALATVPEAVARKLKLIPIAKTPEYLLVAISDPFNIVALDDIKATVGCELNVVLASEREILAAVKKYYENARKNRRAGRGKVEESPDTASLKGVISLALPVRLAEILVKQGAITRGQLDEALEIQKRSQAKLGSILISKGFIAQDPLLEFVAGQCGIGYINLGDVAEIPQEAIALVPKKFAREHMVLPLNLTDDRLMVAISDPLNVLVLDELKKMTGREVKAVLALEGEIKAGIDAHYQRRSSEDAADPDSATAQPQDQEALGDVATDLEALSDAAWADESQETAAADRPVDYAEAEEKLSQMVEEAQEQAFAPEAGEVELQEAKVDVAEIDPRTPEVQKIVNSIILNALSMKASDIHIEPFEDPNGKHSRIRVRYRVDGVLRSGKLATLPWMYRNAIMTKIKILTETMSITEHRVPQTGHIHVMAKNNPVEFRVEMIPTVYGESCVMRVMDRREMLVDVNKLGFLPDMKEKFLDQLKGIGGKKNFGLVLVCGPSGSGKSTTLYAALNHIKRPDIKIWTAENPVEYNIAGVVQVSVNPDIKLGEGKRFNFASSLRSFLRLDPDVIMVGEIRDEETAEIAMEAAMTGHLVFATLHTNDAPSAISRLVGMGLPGYLIADTLKAVIAQRLSRRLCPDCKQAYDPKPEDKAAFKDNHVELPAGTTLFEPKGCAKCMASGYRGRVGTYELMVVGDNVRAACHKDVSAANICRAAIKDGMRLLMQDSLEKVKLGLTSLREVLGRAGGLSAG